MLLGLEGIQNHFITVLIKNDGKLLNIHFYRNSTARNSRYYSIKIFLQTFLVNLEVTLCLTLSVECEEKHNSFIFHPPLLILLDLCRKAHMCVMPHL